MFSVVVCGLLLGLFVAFLDEIIDWARDILESCETVVKKGNVLLQRIGRKIKKIFSYIYYGVEKRTTVIEEHELTDSEIDEMVPNPLSVAEAEALKRGREVKIGEVSR